MKTRPFLALIPLAVAVLLAGLMLFVQTQSSLANPDTLYVAPGGTCGGGVPNCYASIQDAVDAAAPGDEIRVAAGTYTDLSVRPRIDVTNTGTVTQVLYLVKTVTVRGGYSPDFIVWDPQTYITTLDAQGLGRGVYIVGNISPALEGLVITGGDASGMAGYYYYGYYDAGGGVYILNANARLTGNQISGNSAVTGAGVFLIYTNSRLENNQIINNAASQYGGGISAYQGAPVLDGNILDDNQSGNLGGGMYLFSTGATLSHNQITNNNTFQNGGGVEVASCNPRFDGNIFAGNIAFNGGGVFLWYSHSQFVNNVFLENHVTSSGSGLYSAGSTPVLLHSTFSLNDGGDGSALFVGLGNLTPSSLTITNTVLVSHSVGISIAGDSSAYIDGVLWYNTPITLSQGIGSVDIQNQHSGDPMLGPDGYHLTPGSAAIHQGQPAGVLVDIDGQPRSLAAPDLGADQYWLPGAPRLVYLPLVVK